jgi:hypothetical protein
MVNHLFASRGFRRCLQILALMIGATTALAADVDTQQATPLVHIENGFDLRLPVADFVTYHGIMSLDKAGGPKAQVLYPGYGGLAGLLVGIATHGAIVEAEKSSEKARIQKDADKVIEPYSNSLSGFTYRELVEQALRSQSVVGHKKIIGATEYGDGLVITTHPVFFLTQDQRALVLENEIRISRADSPKDDLYRNMFRIISDPRAAGDLTGYWGGDEAKPIKELSQKLFVQSLKLVMAVVGARSQPGLEKTFRFYEGGNKQIERGRLLQQECSRVAILNLRGWVVSVPAPELEVENVECLPLQL